MRFLVAVSDQTNLHARGDCSVRTAPVDRRQHHLVYGTLQDPGRRLYALFWYHLPASLLPSILLSLCELKRTTYYLT